MLEHISYIFFFGFFITIFIFAYIYLKYGFWVIQPVFHIYDISYYLKPPGIIDERLPEKNKYTNFQNIQTILFSDLSKKSYSVKLNRFVQFIKSNYLQNRDNIFSPNETNIVPYLSSHNDKTFVSLYEEKYMLVDSVTNQLTEDDKIIGCMTSRPLSVYFLHGGKGLSENDEKGSSFEAYYVDYLCVDMYRRKKGIAPQLIQTHHYNQRILNRKSVVSIFKREDELTGIVPLCAYETFGFYLNDWKKPADLSAQYKLLEVNPQNYRFLYDFMGVNTAKFDLFVKPCDTNVLELIKTKNIFVYVILCDEVIQCAYFFRKSCVQIEKGLEVLSCFASICDCDENIFIQGFKISFWKIAAENYFGFCAIENISHNNIFLNNIIQTQRADIVSPTAYYFYNFAYPTFLSSKVLIIN